jgi:phosphatidylserine/phosphatidylglycerophosphate/cardiolipin synthase-like enzyme
MTKLFGNPNSVGYEPNPPQLPATTCRLWQSDLRQRSGPESRAVRKAQERPGVEVRTKRDNSALMHLKSYQIDGRWLRTGAANFSASGLKRQDNDLIVIESRGAAASFKRNFDARFASGEALPAGGR